MHLLLAGKPSCGKTTLIKNLLDDLPDKRGFFTEEIREKKGRVGFKVVTLSGAEVVFAHKNFTSPYKVSEYKIDVSSFDSTATKELQKALESNCKFVIIDELGKMELFSTKFKRVVHELFNRKKIIGAISIIKDPFLEEIRARGDACILNLTRENFGKIRKEAELVVRSLPVDKMRGLEKKAKDLGLEERILIENASSNLLSSIEQLKLGKKVAVIAGRGNNGADVLSCARKMKSRDYDVKVVIVAEKKQGQEALFQREILEKLGVPIHTLDRNNVDDLESILQDRDFILDGILGIGLKGEVSPFLKNVIARINGSNKEVVSCDIPSGLSPDEGIPLGQAIKANYTITFLAPKQGFFLNQGKNFCGKIFVVDIGISREILEKSEFRNSKQYRMTKI